MKQRWIVAALFIMLILFAAAVRPALAAGEEIIMDRDVAVTSGQSIDNLIVFGNDAVVKGTVRGSVIVIDGDLTIEKNARIGDVVLVIGGIIKQQDGANVSDEVLNIKFGNGATIGFLIAAILLVAGWALRLAVSLLLIVFAVLTRLALSKRRSPEPISFGRSPFRLAAIGLVTGLLLLILFLFLAVSVIGLVFAVLLFILWLVFFFVTFSTVAEKVGKKWAGHEQRAALYPVLCGAIILVGFLNIPFLGGFLLLGLMWLATGWMVVYFYDKVKPKKSA